MYVVVIHIHKINIIICVHNYFMCSFPNTENIPVASCLNLVTVIQKKRILLGHDTLISIETSLNAWPSLVGLVPMHV